MQVKRSIQRGGVKKTISKDDALEKIEETQAALRDSIEKRKELAAESEWLVRRYRREGGKPKPSEPSQ